VWGPTRQWRQNRLRACAGSRGGQAIRGGARPREVLMGRASVGPKMREGETGRWVAPQAKWPARDGRRFVFFVFSIFFYFSSNLSQNPCSTKSNQQTKDKCMFQHGATTKNHF
jgi:hypothetical protein